ncbi:hypothetical protein GUJ93_ZPchr0008g11768 [Zizania palustris]|uniref:Bifunctional inhibitor/plant lipid transfer protein/seed storage helical domain-containing protein n=1 Tax=Zizania palustris TaxID=103762 RepID=A0A8J5RY25_ZIZPA|nr:hypothetical protein GUJ93_ZPchr0008g11768 [Zizania palustris]
MASTRSTANYAVAAVVVAMLCLRAAKLSAACVGGEPCQPTSLLPPLLPPVLPPLPLLPPLLPPVLPPLPLLPPVLPPVPLLPPVLPPPPARTAAGKCPMNVVKLGVCASVLDGLMDASVGKEPPKAPCCPMIAGLADVDAAVCVCLAIKADVLDVSLNIPIDLSLLLNYCGLKVPDGFQCA